MDVLQPFGPEFGRYLHLISDELPIFSEGLQSTRHTNQMRRKNTGNFDPTFRRERKDVRRFDAIGLGVMRNLPHDLKQSLRVPSP